MKIISHRGNINGRIEEAENKPEYILDTLSMGYNVEIDVWFVDGEWWLGHDEPQYKITHRWLRERRNHLWIHCKDIQSAKDCWIYQSFCHTADPFTYTSTGKIWLHDLTMKVDNRVIIPLLSSADIEKLHLFDDAFAVCTDYPAMCK